MKSISFQTKIESRGQGNIMKAKHLPIVILKVKEQYRITQKCCCRWWLFLMKCGICQNVVYERN